MPVKLPVCIVADANSSQEEAQYITLMEPGGGEYQLTAHPVPVKVEASPAK